VKDPETFTRAPSAAESVSFTPAELMAHPANVATPLTSVTGLVVQVRVPAPPTRVRVTWVVESPTTVLPAASASVTIGCGAKGLLCKPPAGDAVYTS
jgi:hypothetical protein